MRGVGWRAIAGRAIGIGGVAAVWVGLAAAPARAAVQNVPCARPFVFTGADVNVVVLPFSAPDEVRVPPGVGEQLAVLVQREVMLAIVKYGRVGSVQLAGRAEQGCTPEAVLAKLVGEQPGAEAQLRPGAGLVLVWGRIYTAEEHLYLQTYVRFLRRGVEETVTVPVGTVRLVARPSAQAFACVPRRIEIDDLRRIHDTASRQALVFDSPDSTSPRPLPTDGAFSYYVLETRGDWMHIREHSGTVEGWIRATASSDTWMLRDRMAELWFVEGAVAYLLARMREAPPGVAQARELAPASGMAALARAADHTMEAYRSQWSRGALDEAGAVSSPSAALALGVPMQLRAMLRLLAPSAELPEAAHVWSGRALERLSWSADAESLHVVATLATTGTGPEPQGSPVLAARWRDAQRSMRRALSLEPTNPAVLQTLEATTAAALRATRAAIQMKGTGPPPDTPATRELSRQLDAIRRLRAKAQPGGGG